MDQTGDPTAAFVNAPGELTDGELSLLPAIPQRPSGNRLSR